jgi:hypothetical protein
MRILNQELSKLRPGGASCVTGVRDRSGSVSLDVSTGTAASGKEAKVSFSSSPSPWKPSLQKLDDGVGVRGSKPHSTEPVQVDDAADDILPPSQNAVRASNVLKAAHFFETGQEEPDTAAVHRSILTELRKIPQIKAMPSRDVEAAVQASVRLEGSPQQILMRKGDTDAFMIFTVIGSLCVQIDDQSPTSEISSGSLLGYHALLYKRPRSATVSCIGHCVYYRIEMNQQSSGSAPATKVNSFQPDASDIAPKVGDGALLRSEQPSVDSAAGSPSSSLQGMQHASDALKLTARGTKQTVSTDQMAVSSALPVDTRDGQGSVAQNTAFGQC